jgi:predicted O-linked N-acetylglucosamine transferase (SPINDLY family)
VLSPELTVTLWTSRSAAGLHTLATLELILSADAQRAVVLHKEAKALNSTQIPPLAKLHIDGHNCGGLGDLYYVSAVITKQLVDSDLDSTVLLKGLTTLITLTSDSGLHHEAERMLQLALSIASSRDDLQHELFALLFRASVMTPAVYESMKHLKETRDLLNNRVTHLLGRLQNHSTTTFQLVALDEFVLSPTFYFVYQGYNDKKLLASLHKAYALAYSALGETSISPLQSRSPSPNHQTSRYYQNHARVRVGFVSAHFRRHSICKLYCGIISNLDKNRFDVFVFSALQETHEDDHTRKLASATNFVRIGKTLIQNRFEVLTREIDVLVYLDVGMDPATVVWAAARLAPTQVLTWGHPTTTGLETIDYFLSSDVYHTRNGTGVESLGGDSEDTSEESMFAEQLVRLDALGIYFQRPRLGQVKLPPFNASERATMRDLFTKEESGSLTRKWAYAMSVRPDSYYEAIGKTITVTTPSYDDLKWNMKILIEEKRDGAKVVLCPQHLPKFHPRFDLVLRGILESVPQALLVIIGQEKKKQWIKTLTSRWRRTIGNSLMRRIVWLDSVNPDEYVSLLSIGDIMLDPFPFGGGVTTMEAIAVCTPVVTAPRLQTVPALARGMISNLNLPNDLAATFLIADSVDDYVRKATLILNGDERGTSASLTALRIEICRHSHKLFEDKASVFEWELFLSNAASY